MYDHELDHIFTLCPTAVLLRLQIHRLLTSPFLHSSAVHMGMSILTLFSLGTFLEFRFGTLWLFLVIPISAMLVSAMYTLIAFIMYFSGLKNVVVDHTFGFSKVAFHLLVVECHQALKPFSVWGICEVKPKLYPWVSLILTQLILQHVSFIGHLSGIIVGYLHITGFLDRLLPSVQKLRLLDANCYLNNYHFYIRVSSADDLYTNNKHHNTWFQQVHEVANNINQKLLRSCKKNQNRLHCSKNNGTIIITKEKEKKHVLRKHKLSSDSLDVMATNSVLEEVDYDVEVDCLENI